MLRCPVHNDSTASFSLDIEKGAWYCHAEKIGGGPVELEMRISDCDADTAVATIADLLGDPQLGFVRSQQPEAVYRYRDEDGIVIVEKLRYPRKHFAQRKPDGKGGWEYKLGETQKPLYNAPEVITANHVLIAEGEKDCDRLTSLDLAQYDPKRGSRVAATTNIDGAGKWRAEYSPFFTGKLVAIFADNDEVGRHHAQTVAASIHPYAHLIRLVELPDLPEHGDVSDYLDAHTAKELLTEIRKTPAWKSASPRLLVSAPEFDALRAEEIVWLVEGVIQRGANGFICGQPKGGKSWVAVDLAVSLATGQWWIGFRVGMPCRVAFISREDNPALTKWRMWQVARAKGHDLAELGDMLWVNSRDQSPEFRLDKPEQLAEMIAELKHVQPELVILDVFKILHAADENDSAEMRAVLECLTVIRREVNASVCVVHHFSKADSGSMTQRLRGSSAIAGWAEFLIGVQTDEETKKRRLSFELKAASPPDAVHFLIDSNAGPGTVLHRIDPPPRVERGRSRAEELLQ